MKQFLSALREVPGFGRIQLCDLSQISSRSKHVINASKNYGFHQRAVVDIVETGFESIERWSGEGIASGGSVETDDNYVAEIFGLPNAPVDRALQVLSQPT